MARIIVVDNEPAVLDAIARYLRGLGHDVRTAVSGREGLKAVEEEMPDVVVTDINMPDMDGIELITGLRENAVDVPIIAMSGGGLFHKELLLDSAGMLGAGITLAKPFDLEELRKAVETLVGEANPL